MAKSYDVFNKQSCANSETERYWKRCNKVSIRIKIENSKDVIKEYSSPDEVPKEIRFNLEFEELRAAPYKVGVIVEHRGKTYVLSNYKGLHANESYNNISTNSLWADGYDTDWDFDFPSIYVEDATHFTDVQETANSMYFGVAEIHPDAFTTNGTRR